MMQQTILNHLKAGRVIGLPTDTVYGLAADARSDLAVAEIYALKSRPSFNPLIIHVHSLAQAQLYGFFNEDAVRLAHHFWAPSQTASALTIVVPYKKDSGISSLALAGLDTIALRVPNHPLALQVLVEFGGPLAAPSANPSNYLSPTTADHVRVVFPELPVLDGGPCSIGIESTIVYCKDGGVSLLRPGIVTEDLIRDFVPLIRSQPSSAENGSSAAIRSPGALKKHYAPKTPMAMNVASPLPSHVYIGFGPNYPSVINLSETGDLKEAAANLFRHLHVADKLGKKRIAVAPIPSYGIGQAINDRLSRGIKSPSHA
jgi:L-threonylcarbamoyladenylate synthase